MKQNAMQKLDGMNKFNQIKIQNHQIIFQTREMIKISTIAVIHYFSNGHFSEASVIDFKYIKMTGLQDFY